MPRYLAMATSHSIIKVKLSYLKSVRKNRSTGLLESRIPDPVASLVFSRLGDVLHTTIKYPSLDVNPISKYPLILYS